MDLSVSAILSHRVRYAKLTARSRHEMKNNLILHVNAIQADIARLAYCPHSAVNSHRHDSTLAVTPRGMHQVVTFCIVSSRSGRSLRPALTCKKILAKELCVTFSKSSPICGHSRYLETFRHLNRNNKAASGILHLGGSFAVWLGRIIPAEQNAQCVAALTRERVRTWFATCSGKLHWSLECYLRTSLAGKQCKHCGGESNL